MKVASSPRHRFLVLTTIQRVNGGAIIISARKSHLISHSANLHNQPLNEALQFQNVQETVRLEYQVLVPAGNSKKCPLVLESSAHCTHAAAHPTEFIRTRSRSRPDVAAPITKQHDLVGFSTSTPELRNAIVDASGHEGQPPHLFSTVDCQIEPGGVHGEPLNGSNKRPVLARCHFHRLINGEHGNKVEHKVLLVVELGGGDRSTAVDGEAHIGIASSCGLDSVSQIIDRGSSHSTVDPQFLRRYCMYDHAAEDGEEGGDTHRIMHFAGRKTFESESAGSKWMNECSKCDGRRSRECILMQWCWRWLKRWISCREILYRCRFGYDSRKSLAVLYVPILWTRTVRRRQLPLRSSQIYFHPNGAWTLRHTATVLYVLLVFHRTYTVCRQMPISIIRFYAVCAPPVFRSTVIRFRITK